MPSIEEHAALVKKIDSSALSQAMFEFIRSIESEMVALNREQLNEKSKDVYGDAIGFYSSATEAITGGRKKAGEPFDAKESGDFLDKMYARIERETIVFGSTDIKTKLILSYAGSEFNNTGWLSSDLFGLTDQDLQKVIEDRIKPFVIAHSRKMIAL